MLGTLKSSVTHSLLLRRAEYLALNKRSKISTDFRLCKKFNANLFETSYELKKSEMSVHRKGENDSFKRPMTQSFNPQSMTRQNFITPVK